MTPRDPASAGNDGAEAFEFTGDITDYWTFTQVRDWVLMMPGISRTALHLYLLLRSMVSEAARRHGGGLRRMSLDQLCWLLPGVNDKPASPTMIKDALRLLSELNLVVNPEEARLVTSTGKGGLQNSFRKYQVKDMPPDVYQGWRNVWDKLDAYRPDWREQPPQPPVHSRTDDGVTRTSADSASAEPARTHPGPPAPSAAAGSGPAAPGPAAMRQGRGARKRPVPASPELPSPRAVPDGEAASDEVVDMLVSLPGRMHRSDALDLANLASAALVDGWSVQGLREHLSRKCDPERVFDVAAVYRKHLKRLPAAPRGTGGQAAAVPPCTVCSGSGWVEDPTTFLPTKRCDCRSTPSLAPVS